MKKCQDDATERRKSQLRKYKIKATTIKNGQYYSTTEIIEAYDRNEAIAQFQEKMLILYEPPRTPRHIFAYGRDVEFNCEPSPGGSEE